DLRDAHAAGILFHQESGKARERLEDAGSRASGERNQGAGARDRPAKDEGFELRYHRGGDAHGGRVRPFHGHRGRGVIAMTNLGKRTTAIREGVDRTKLYSLEEAGKMVQEQGKAKFDEPMPVALNPGGD